MRVTATIWHKGCLVFCLLLLCGLAACAANSATTNSATAPTTNSSTPHAPTATVAVAGGLTLSPTPAATPTHSAKTAAPTLTCQTHTEEGDEDDSVRITLNCSVTHAAAADTSFTLHYGILDPVGHYQAFPQTCDGHLHNGAGSCSQTYTGIFPYAPTPGPVTGEFLPSHRKLGPVTPSIM